MPKTCNYFITYQCNDACEFCEMWRRDEEGLGRMRKDEEGRNDEILRGLKREGVRSLHITGGEPLLREDLPEILRKAKQLGLFIELATNGILYPEKSRLMGGLVDRLMVSLDYPMASEHDRSRGVECFGEAIRSIKLAKELGEKPIINFTLTRDSVRFLPEMVDLSEKLGAPVNFNPVYDFYGTQGFEPATIRHIKYYARRKNVRVNLAALEFVKAGGNNVLFPRCRAQETTVTILPDGREAAPCFFNQGGKQGKEAVCSACMRWPYMLPSFTRGWDKYFWLNLYSKFEARRKIFH